MPEAKLNGATIWFDDTGGVRETIVFGHGLAFSSAMFDAQVAGLRSAYRCVTFDLRGHGRSELTADGYDMDTLAGDAIALIELLGTAPVHFVGWSIGGFIGLRIAARRPELVRTLTLIGSASIDGRETDFAFKMVPTLASVLGMGAITGSLMKSMFSRAFLDDPARRALRDEWRDRFRADRKRGVARAARGVIAQRSIAPELAAIALPVLVVRGEVDAVVPLEAAQRTTDQIAGARLITVPGAGHACTIEAPEVVNATLASFFAETAAAGERQVRGR